MRSTLRSETSALIYHVYCIHYMGPCPFLLRHREVTQILVLLQSYFLSLVLLTSLPQLLQKLIDRHAESI